MKRTFSPQMIVSKKFQSNFREKIQNSLPKHSFCIPFHLNLTGFLKTIYSEKATKFCEILLLTAVKVRGRFRKKNFVAFSEYMNFKRKKAFVGCLFSPSKIFSTHCDKLCWLALVSRHNICSIMLACSTYFV